jgi:hypothetical protein
VSYVRKAASRSYPVAGAWSDGDRSALDRLLPLVESELHRLAHCYMSHERQDHTRQTRRWLMRPI